MYIFNKVNKTPLILYKIQTNTIVMAFQIISTLLIAIALAMDAFSVSLTKGFTQKNLTKNQILCYGLFFGFFQFMIPPMKSAISISANFYLILYLSFLPLASTS